MTDIPKVGEDFARAVQYIFTNVDHAVHETEVLKEQKAGYIVGITIPDKRDNTHRIVAMLADPSHPEVIEGMVTKFFKSSSYGVFPVAKSEDR